jgi:acylphosphatase
MSITYGSIGDIIGISLLVKDVLPTLDDARGSAAEYQAAKRGLRCFDRALLQVEQLKASTNETPQLRKLYAEVEQVAKEGRVCLEEFHDRVRKYGKRLDGDGSGNLLKDTVRKLEWRVAGKAEEVEKFQKQISAYTQALTLLLTTAGMYAHRVVRLVAYC